MSKKANGWIIVVIVVLAALLIANLLVSGSIFSSLGAVDVFNPSVQLAPKGGGGGGLASGGGGTSTTSFGSGVECGDFKYVDPIDLFGTGDSETECLVNLYHLFLGTVHCNKPEDCEFGCDAFSSDEEIENFIYDPPTGSGEGSCEATISGNVFCDTCQD